MKRSPAVILLTNASQMAFAAPVKIKFTNTGKQPGKIQIAVFNNARYFPDNEAGIVLKDAVTVTRAQTTAEVSIDLPEGDYAISVFLDENGNKKLDTNFMGIPTERFGFSNNPTVRFGVPRFSQCEVRVEDTGANLSINLKKFL